MNGRAIHAILATIISQRLSYPMWQTIGGGLDLGEGSRKEGKRLDVLKENAYICNNLALHSVSSYESNGGGAEERGIIFEIRE